LTIAAAVFVGVVTDRVTLVEASRGVAAWVVATALLATTVALFIAFNNTVATLLASDRTHIPVVAQAICPDIVVADGTADVTDRARKELVNTALTQRVHDVSSIGVAGVCI
jgi:hypothetical protein